MCFSKELIKSALSAFLVSLILTFTGCYNSNLAQKSTGSITFKINTSRAVTSRQGEIAEKEEASGLYIDIELLGDYEQAKTVALNLDSETDITFEEVPIGSAISVLAKIYTLIGDQKNVIYFGEAAAQTIKAGENTFTVSFEKEFNSTTETASGYVVTWPTLTIEHSSEALTTNKLSFRKVEGEDPAKWDETFCWKLQDLADYQTLKLTLKGDSLYPDEEHGFNFSFVKTNTGARYFQKLVPVTTDKATIEFAIPQGIGLNAFGIENRWVVGADEKSGGWAGDYNCYIEKIELIKDSDLIDPDFNKITKETDSYIVKNPAMQAGASVSVDKNSVTFDSISEINISGNPYSSAYWEFEDLADYDKVYITVKCDNPNATGMKFLLKGYSPINYPDVTEAFHSAYNGNCACEIEESSTGVSKTFIVEVPDLLTEFPGKKATAIEFQNSSYLGEWTDNNFGEPWTLQVEEIKLLKTGLFTINIAVPGSQDIEVKIADITSDGKVTGKIFTAPEGYNSYVWKVNSVVQECTDKEFTFDMTSLAKGIYDITLLANNETFHHSWNAQITKE